MKKILTINGFDVLEKIKYGGEGEGINDVYAIANILGVNSKIIGALKPTKYSQLKAEVLKQAVEPAAPSYLVKYKGKTFGYYPVQLSSVEEMAAVEVLSRDKKWSALAAILFREVKPISRWAHRKNNRWTSSHGIQVKQITDFKKDSLFYTCKKINFNKLDFGFWDEFPWAILQGNLAFLLGSGLKFSLSIHPASLKSNRIRKEVIQMTENFQEVLVGLTWQKVSPQLMCLISTEEKALSTWLQEKHSTMLLNDSNKQWLTQLKEQTALDAWVVTGDLNKGILEALYSLQTNLLTNTELKVNDLLTLCGLMKVSSANKKLSWLIST